MPLLPSDVNLYSGEANPNDVRLRGQVTTFSQNVNVTGLGSAASFGTVTLTTGNVNVQLVGLGSAASFGTVTIKRTVNIVALGASSLLGTTDITGFTNFAISEKDIWTNGYTVSVVAGSRIKKLWAYLESNGPDLYISVYDDDGGTISPGTLLKSVQMAAGGAPDWVSADVDVSSPTSGKLWIGFQNVNGAGAISDKIALSNAGAPPGGGFFKSNDLDASPSNPFPQDAASLAWTIGAYIEIAPASGSFGTLSVKQTVPVTGLGSAASFGTLKTNTTVNITGLGSAAAFGTVTFSRTVNVTGLNSAASFGTLKVNHLIPVVGLGASTVSKLGTTDITGYTMFSITEKDVWAQGHTVSVSPGSRISKLWAYLEPFGTDLYIAVWDDDGSTISPGTLLASAQIPAGGAAGWVSANVDVVCPASGKVWIGFQNVNGSGGASDKIALLNTAAPGGAFFKNSLDTAPSNPFPQDASAITWQIGAYIEIAKKFGNTDDRPGGVGTLTDFQRATEFTMLENGTIKRIDGKVRALPATTHVWRFGIWKLDGPGGTPLTLACMTGELTTSSNTYAEMGGTVADTYLPAGNYAIGTWAKDANGQYGIHDAIGVEYDGQTALPYESVSTARADPYSYTGTFSRSYGFYASYDAAPASGSFGTLTTNRTVNVTGLGSAASFGTTHPSANVQGLNSAASFGTLTINRTVDVTGLGSAAAFGTTTYTQTGGGQSVNVTGLGSAASFGTVTFKTTVNVTGLGSAASFGTLQINRTVNVTGLGSAAAFGTPTINRTVNVTGLNSAASFGTLSINRTVNVTGLNSAAAFGTTHPSGNVGGLTSTAQFGTVTLKTTVNITGLNSAATFGTTHPSGNVGGLTSTAQFGTVTFRTTVNVTGLTSTAAFGTPTANRTVNVTGLSSTPAFGTIYIQRTVNITGLNSAAAFGGVSTTGAQAVNVTGLNSAASFGSIYIQRTVNVTALTGTPLFGTPIATFSQNVNVTGLTPTPTFGAVTTNTTTNLTGLSSTYVFGSVNITTGNVNVQVTGLPAAPVFGVPTTSTGQFVDVVGLNGSGGGTVVGAAKMIFDLKGHPMVRIAKGTYMRV